MIELVDTCPDVNVQPAEYKRLLGYPRDWVVRDRARELVAWARDWYTRNGQPWVYAREADTLETVDGSIVINGVAFTSARLSRTLRQAGAHSLVLVAVGAGVEVEQEAQTRWRDGKPDEYFFLEVYGSAIVEHLMTMTGARLCAWAETHGMAVLPHYSPGYSEWAIDEQPRLLALINGTRPHMQPIAVDVLESGMLRPKKSLLAVFGVTRNPERVQRLTDLIPCENCSFAPCQYRRVPYRRAPQPASPELPALAGAAIPVSSDRVATPLDPLARYTVNRKALDRWSRERLSLAHQEDGTVRAMFRYEGTTCTNTGRRLEFHYQVMLGPREEGYPIRAQRCSPAPGDKGHTDMCRYMTNREHLMVAIDRDQPLYGRPLNDVLTWARPDCAAGCYCEPDSRTHKWGLVLETIHYALARDAAKSS
jgi:hypothetical protein